MDEWIMKVLEAAGARIADLEADFEEQVEINEDLAQTVHELTSKNQTLKDEITALQYEDAEKETRLCMKDKEITDKAESITYWYGECKRLEKEIEALKAKHAGVEAVD